MPISTINFLPDHNFALEISRLPNCTFFAKDCQLPSVALNSVRVPNPLIVAKVPGDHLEYSPFEFSFTLNEDFSNYIEIFNWINSLGFPDNNTQYKKIQDNPIYSGKGLTSDGILFILDANKNPNIEIHFAEMIPTSISPIPLSIDAGDVRYSRATVTFDYRRFYIKKPVEGV